jgi:hypothetical protein
VPLAVISPSQTGSRSWDLRLVIDLALLALMLWLAHDFHFCQFGLYEDDFTHTSPALAWRASDLSRVTVFQLQDWVMGRPLHYVLGAVLAFLGGQLGGLAGIYMVAYLVHITNAALCSTCFFGGVAMAKLRGSAP